MIKAACFNFKTISSTMTKIIGNKNWLDISYKFVNWFQLNLPYPNGKKFSASNVKKNSHFQMDIFYFINVCHSRKNASASDVVPQQKRSY